MKRRLYSGRDYLRAQNIEELREVARRRLPNFSFEYVEGGSDDEFTLKRNRSIFESITLQPRTLRNVSTRNLSRSFFGKPSALPFLIGPTGFNGLLTDKGDLRLAEAATQAGIPFVLSNASTTSIEDISRIEGVRAWMQIYLYRTRDHVAKLVERVKALNLEAIVVTTDSAIFGNREWDRRNYIRPLKLNWRNQLDVAMHPEWVWDVLVPRGVPRFKNLGDLLPPGRDSVKGAASALAAELDPSLNWQDIAWLRDMWKGRLIIKGIIHPADVELALQYGVDGIVLSNHGGRQLDGSVSAMETLPEVARIAKGKLEIFLDGGFRRGSDIVKALLLGADGVLIGRAGLYGLAAGKGPGACLAIDILRTEVERTLGLLGCSSLDELSADLIHDPKWRAAADAIPLKSFASKRAVLT
ncbi:MULTISPECIES: alpha-hydroxy acid oxidase [Pseudomonas]|uniref:(S)-mandelate dehydrogenase n=1 Tax=Pseudomonas luteola TaxID=47886 RepID=A0A2X2DBQ9_PSELU|nr:MULTISPECIES: alpha-hydroxy acid oxidase [Pseudomonas]MBF8642712.1 alpha-hydroxy-acid oxidizing protein [Pseudomonas zeshuii]RRW44570.1 alpha-hydroxy-acid oxidizing protein [Pseudomonas luteola]SHJ37355.1 (S)-mandelate dehydrogenase [Pseudomonas zeshuii]SPZ16824.1 (S)-mandelate dehydrogenase [Pseudomonas luteola]